MGNGNQSREAPLRETVLLVDDDASVRRALLWTLNSDYHVLEANSRAEAVKLLQQQDIDVVVSDLHLPPRLEEISEGLAVIEAARDTEPPVQVVVITGTNDKSAAREAVKRGAYGFFEKPLDSAEVLHVVNQAARMRRLAVVGMKSGTSSGTFTPSSKLCIRAFMLRLTVSVPALMSALRRA
jgi:DNA-binding NtrC family response regulator